MVLVGIGVFISQMIFCWKTVSALVHETMEVLSERELNKLKEHKYKRDGDYTLLEPYFQPFWSWVVEKCPMWWAPNAITFIGLLINVITAMILIIYNPDGKSYAPSWAYVLAALGLFIYQTLDAIDGKQARRTGSASPLGELFDHGCDAVSTVVLTIAAQIHMRYTTDWLMFLVMGAFSAFYVAHWVTYCTGALSFGKIDVVELQVLMMVGFLQSAVLGEDFWLIEVPYIEVQLNIVIAWFVILSGLYYYLKAFHTIFVKGGVGKHGSTVADTSVLFPVFPLLTFIILTVIISIKSGTIYQENPALYLATFGFVFAKITCKVIVAHMCKSELLYWDSIYCGPLILFMNQYFDFFFPEYYILWISFAFTLLSMLHYSHAVSSQICHSLNIYCFSIQKPPPKSESNSTSHGNGQSNRTAPVTRQNSGRIRKSH